HIDSQILDEEINYNGYMPKNIGDKYYGYISVKDAVAKSLNIPAIKVMSSVGIEKCKEFGKKLGIKFDPNDTGYSLALGGFTSGITLDELVNSYTPFINEGKYNKYTYIKEIRDKNNNIIYSREYKDTKVMGDDTTFLMNNVLKYSVKNGTSKKLSNCNYDIAGKTGTVASNDGISNTDVYSLAYTSEIIMGVWFGNYSMDEKYHLDASNNGGTYATSLIKDTFNDIYISTTPPPFNISPNVVELDINKNILNNNHIIELASSDTPDIYKMKALFSDRYKPTLDKLSVSNNIIMPKLNISTNKNSINISFDTIEYQRYKLYEINNNIKALILEISNSKDTVYYTKQNINNNEKYSYYIEVENIFTHKKQTTKEIDVLINYDYNNFDKIIDNEYNESLWYFR
ncbi:MAG: hypothetical protein IJW28_03900, partial [Clostridia bacterium]|nr:hypothetical protein [Clostridia bacterium]